MFDSRPFPWRELFSALWLALLVACGPNQDPDRLTLGGPFEFTSQDPARDGFVYTRMQVAETLVDVDPQGNLLPGLATSWQANEESTEWVFSLRRNVLFHDGAPMDAAAVANSLRMALSKPGVVTNSPIRAVQVTGSHQLSITTRTPYRLLPALLAHFSSAILSPGSYTEDAGVPWMYGTGPYQITGFDPPHRIEVTRFDGYWGEPARIENAVYLTGHRAESRALQVMAEQTDIIYTLDPASLDLLSRQDHVRVYSDTIPRTIQIKLNSSHPFMMDADSRRAMSLALDRSGIVEEVIRVPGTEANQLVPPFLDAWHLEDLPPIEHDPDSARQLLAEKGWAPAGDGILTRDGERFELEMITYADRPELIVIATVIQAQWRDVGIDLAVNVVNSSGIPRKHLDGSLETALVARNYGNIADPLGVFAADYGDSGNGEWGAMGWQNEIVPDLIERMMRSTDTATYVQGAQQVSRILAEALPVIPVAFYTQQTATSERVLNFSFDPYERNYRIAEMRFAEP